jgi:hypothetical protein
MADDEEAPPAPQWMADKEGETAGPFSEEGLPHGQVRAHNSTLNDSAAIAYLLCSSHALHGPKISCMGAPPGLLLTCPCYSILSSFPCMHTDLHISLSLSVSC